MQFDNAMRIQAGASTSYVLALASTGPTTEVQLFVSPATPEGVITGSPGDVCFVDTGAVGRLFLKTAGAGNTGWQELVAGGMRKVAATIGDGAALSYVVIHNLGTTDVLVQVRAVATGAQELVNNIAIAANQITVTFDSAPAVNSYRVIIGG